MTKTEPGTNSNGGSYLVDGNAYFFTAVDVARRLEFTNSTRCIVVGIGYPPSKYVYDWRRGPDFTPKSPDGKYEYPLDSNGNPRTDVKFGEAHLFTDFIQNEVMTHVEENLFPHIPLRKNRKAFWGHSYGGILSLNTLFTRPTLFNTFIAASPTISWNKYFLVHNREAAFRGLEKPVDPAPSVLITHGTGSQDLVQRPGESDEEFKNRKDDAELPGLREDTKGMLGRLADCPSIRNTWSWEFVGEDHGSAATTGVQKGVIKFLVDKF